MKNCNIDLAYKEKIDINNIKMMIYYNNFLISKRDLIVW